VIDLIANPDEIILQDEPHRYLQGGKSYVSVTGAVEDAGLGEDFSMVPRHIMERAQDRGNKVHMACEFINDDDLCMDSITDEIRGYVEAYLRFRAECKIKIIAAERKIVSAALGFAGTPDLICFMGGRRVVIDLKTCQRLGRGLGLQTAGYQALWEATHPSLIYARYGLKLNASGDYKLIACEDPDDLPAFYDAIQFAKAKEKMQRWILKYKK
jgi:hypothetical protein